MEKEEFCLAKPEEILFIEKMYQSVIGSEGCTWSEEYPTHAITVEDYKREALFCLKLNGEIIGAISIDDDPLVEELPCWDNGLKPSAELARLVVRADYQNHGYARVMIRKSMLELKQRGMSGVHFLVSKTNEKALRSYEKLNFSVVGESNLFGQNWFCYEKSLY